MIFPPDPRVIAPLQNEQSTCPLEQGVERFPFQQFTNLFTLIFYASRGQLSSEDIQLTSNVPQCCLPGHGLCGEELQCVVVQTEPGESEETSKGLNIEIVQRVVTKTEPFDVLQALQE